MQFFFKKKLYDLFLLNALSFITTFYVFKICFNLLAVYCGKTSTLDTTRMEDKTKKKSAEPVSLLANVTFAILYIAPSGCWTENPI